MGKTFLLIKDICKKEREREREGERKSTHCHISPGTVSSLKPTPVSGGGRCLEPNHRCQGCRAPGTRLTQGPPVEHAHKPCGSG